MNGPVIRISSYFSYLQHTDQGICKKALPFVLAGPDTMKYVAAQVVLGAWFYSTWTEHSARPRSRGILLDCQMEAAHGVNVTWSGKSGVQMISDQMGGFELPVQLGAEENLEFHNFSGFAMIGQPGQPAQNWTVGHCHDSPGHIQVAFCPDRLLMGNEVQNRFVDNLVDPWVVCPGGNLVEAALIYQKSGWQVCGSLCPKQTCYRLGTLSELTAALANACLMENVAKNFQNFSFASAEAGLLQVIQGPCTQILSDSLLDCELDSDHQIFKNLQTLVTKHDPYQGSGIGKEILLDRSGSMSAVLPEVKKKLGTEFRQVKLSFAHDSAFTATGDMGRAVLRAVKSMQMYSMLIIVSDFQDGVEESYCAELSALAVEKHVVIVLESVEQYPRPCMHDVAKQTSGHSSIGRIMRK